MKNTKSNFFKHKFQWLVLLVALLGVSQGAWASYSVQIYAYSTSGQPSLWAWNSDNTSINFTGGTWPGWAMTRVSNSSNWYVATITVTSTKYSFLFSYSGNNQSSDITNKTATAQAYTVASKSATEYNGTNKWYYDYILLSTSSFTNWENNSATFKAHLYSDTSCSDGCYMGTINFSSTNCAHLYKAITNSLLPVKGIKIERYDSSGSTAWNHFSINTFSSSHNAASVSSCNDWNCGSKTMLRGDPNITGQPSPTTQNLNVGDTPSTLSVTVSAKLSGTSEFTYQWQKCDTSGGTFEDIDGAKGSSYVPSTASVGTLYYKCKVTGFCEKTSNVSGAVNVTLDCTTPQTGKTITIKETSSGSFDDAVTVCSGTNVTVRVASAQSGYIYRVHSSSTPTAENKLAEGSCTSAGNFDISFDASSSSTCYVFALKSNGCDATNVGNNTVSLTVNPTPTITPSSTTAKNFEAVTLSSSASLNSSVGDNGWAITNISGSDSYLYNTTTTAAKFKGTVGGSSSKGFIIQGTASNGCVGSTTITVSADAAESCN